MRLKCDVNRVSVPHPFHADPHPDPRFEKSRCRSGSRARFFAELKQN